MHHNDDPREAFKYFWEHIAANMGTHNFADKSPFANMPFPFFSFQQTYMKKFMETQLIMLREFQKYAEKQADNQAFDDVMRENCNDFIKAGMSAYLEMKKSARENHTSFSQMQVEMLNEYRQLLEQTVRSMNTQSDQEEMAPTQPQANSSQETTSNPS